MDPAEHVRVVLVEARRQGFSFGEAWVMAIRGLPRPRRAQAAAERLEWLEVLAWARPIYLAAYIGSPVGDLDPLAESNAPERVASAA